jgi:hypothetical protein
VLTGEQADQHFYAPRVGPVHPTQQERHGPFSRADDASECVFVSRHVDLLGIFPEQVAPQAGTQAAGARVDDRARPLNVNLTACLFERAPGLGKGGTVHRRQPQQAQVRWGDSLFTPQYDMLTATEPLPYILPVLHHHPLRGHEQSMCHSGSNAASSLEA